MARRNISYIILVFLVPFFLGVGILGYWYYTVRIEKKVLLPRFGTVPQFALTTERSLPFTQSDLRGNVHIVDFIFTTCGGSCPLMSTKMHDMQDTFALVPHLRLLSFSVDPVTDTPPVLAEYGEAYHASRDRWIFLTGQKDSIYQLMRVGFHLGVDRDTNNAIMHSQKFVLLDSEGEIRGYYDSDDDQAMQTLINDSRILLRNIGQ
jgi:protein SCO1/2